MNNVLVAKVNNKNKGYQEWKQGQVVWEKYRDIVQASRDQIRKDKALIELNLTDIKSKMSTLSKTGDQLHSLWNTKINNFFDWVFNSKCFSHTTWAADDKDRDWLNEELLTVADQAQEHLRSLMMHKSMGPDEMHL